MSKSIWKWLLNCFLIFSRNWTELSLSASPCLSLVPAPLDSLLYDDDFPVLGAHYSRFSISSTKLRIITTFLNLLAVLLLTQTSWHLVFLDAKAHCWLTFNLDPWCSSARLFSSQLVPSLYCVILCWALRLPCWAPWGLCEVSSPGCWDPPQRESLPIWENPKTFWRCVLSHPSCCWWKR